MTGKSDIIRQCGYRGRDGFELGASQDHGVCPLSEARRVNGTIRFADKVILWHSQEVTRV